MPHELAELSTQISRSASRIGDAISRTCIHYKLSEVPALAASHVNLAVELVSVLM